MPSPQRLAPLRLVRGSVGHAGALMQWAVADAFRTQGRLARTPVRVDAASTDLRKVFHQAGSAEELLAASRSAIVAATLRADGVSPARIVSQPRPPSNETAVVGARRHSAHAIDRVQGTRAAT